MDSLDTFGPRFTIADDTNIDALPAAEGRFSTRGVGWVLRWAAALAVLLMSLVKLTNFGFELAAEQLLVRAARAGALEASMPRATYQSVAQSVERRLGSLVQNSNEWKLYLEQNGEPVRLGIRPSGGDRMSVMLVLPGQTALPGWLRRLNFWPRNRPIEVRAERRIPGREIQ